MSTALLKLLRWLIVSAVQHQYEKSGHDVAATAKAIGHAARAAAPRKRPQLRLVKK